MEILMVRLNKKITNFLNSLWHHFLSGMKKVSDGEYQARLDECDLCKFNIDGNCSKCGCIIAIKARWHTQKCPENKWPEVQ